MLVILSQKVDSESSYEDELFKSYHYPSRYKNQLHKGDTFIYYQGNRYDKSQRYYFGRNQAARYIPHPGDISVLSFQISGNPPTWRNSFRRL